MTANQEAEDADDPAKISDPLGPALRLQDSPNDGDSGIETMDADDEGGDADEHTYEPDEQQSREYQGCSYSGSCSR